MTTSKITAQLNLVKHFLTRCDKIAWYPTRIPGDSRACWRYLVAAVLLLPALPAADLPIEAFAGREILRIDLQGHRATREHIIRNGILERPLGGVVSQTRAGISGVANSRANSWNRPPIDRMANLNLEAGDSTLDELISQVEQGVYMKTNCSWSIDDSRNKFQFGCEWAQLIEDGELTTVVKKPNYRSVSATFWRSLKGVGNEETVDVLGSPYCGKGEPNQCVRVGHASPPCLFDKVSVFGGA